MRVRRPLALLVLAATAGLAVGLALAFHGGGATPESAAAAAPAQAAQRASSSAPEAVPSAPVDRAGGDQHTGLTYADGARDVRFEPKLGAASYVALDADTGQILVAKRDRQRRPVASLTKIMTALLVIERGDLSKKVKVPVQATNVEPNREGLKKGRWYERRLLLWSALLVSANDSAAALAYDAGGGSVNRFYGMMNAKARALGMTDTVYHSASGLDDETNLSSARDQAIVVRAALENPVFARIVRTKTKRVTWPPPTYAKVWVNHNKMLWSYAGTYGVKTGYTSKAGGCLAVAVRRNGHAVIAVILHSKDIWKDMPRLVDAAFRRAGP